MLKQVVVVTRVQEKVVEEVAQNSRDTNDGGCQETIESKSSRVVMVERFFCENSAIPENSGSQEPVNKHILLHQHLTEPSLQEFQSAIWQNAIMALN